MKNCLFRCAPDPFCLPYLEAAQTVADLRYLPVGPFFPSAGWNLNLLSGELDKHYLNVVVSPMGASLGLPKRQTDFAPDDAKMNPQLAAQNPTASALASQAQKDRMAYVPETVFQSFYAEGQPNIAVLRPIRAKRSLLELDLEVLKKYDLLLSPSDVAERFRQLGIQVMGCDPSSFAVTLEPWVASLGK